MRKLIGFALMALMLVMTGVGSFAATQQSNKQIAAAKTMMVTGEIALIKGNTLTIKDQAGKEHTYTLGKPAMLQGFKAGEKVTVALENGKVTSIKKVAETKPADQGTEAK
jgi:hypothetical protein